MINVPEPTAPSQAIDTGLRALCGIAAYYRIAADPSHLQRELALIGRAAGPDDLLRAGKLVGLKARTVRRTTDKALSTTPAPAIAQLKTGTFVVYGGRLANGLYRIVDPVTSIDRVLSGRGPRRADRAVSDPPGPPGRRRGDRPEELRLPLVPALHLALPQAARPCALGLAVRADLRPRDPAVLPGGGRQGALAQRLFHPVRAGGRHHHRRAVRRHPAISAHLCALAHHQPHRRRTRPAAVPPPAAPAARLFRDPRRRPDGGPGARAREHPRLPDRPGPVLGARSAVHLRVHRGAVRLFVEALDHRLPGDPDLPAHRRADPPRPAGPGGGRSSTPAP